MTTAEETIEQIKTIAAQMEKDVHKYMQFGPAACTALLSIAIQWWLILEQFVPALDFAQLDEIYWSARHEGLDKVMADHPELKLVDSTRTRKMN